MNMSHNSRRRQDRQGRGLRGASTSPVVTGVTMSPGWRGPALPPRGRAAHDRRVTLPLTIGLLLAAGGDCYFIGNTRILRLPSADLDPGTIAELTEDPSPAHAAGLARQPPRWRGRSPRAPMPAVVVRGNEELERRLEEAQRQRMDAVAERLGAEAARDAALRQRDLALREAAALRTALAAERARAERTRTRATEAQRRR